MLKNYLKNKLDSLSRNKYKTLNTVYIHKQSLAHNVRVFQSINQNKYIIAVLKANAYGHGLKQITEALIGTDVEFIAVDGYFEAHRILPYAGQRILVMGYILPENARLLDSSKCSYVVQDIDGLAALGSINRRFNVHLEINTGMNRLGIDPDELDSYLDELKSHPNIQLEGIMTHLADADNPANDFTDMQTEKFDTIVKKIRSKGFNPKYIHIAQSAGSTKCSSKTANAIRVGIGLYGINPLKPEDSDFKKLDQLKPVLELSSTIIRVRNLAAGEKVSYNGIFETKAETRIGVLPLGYYEWLPRELSNVGVVSTGKQILPIRGRVCMNHVMIDLTKTKLKTGDRVTVISTDNSMPNSITNIAGRYGLFAYSLLTGIAETVRRELVN